MNPLPLITLCLGAPSDQATLFIDGDGAGDTALPRWVVTKRSG